MYIIYKHTSTITNKSYIGLTKNSMEQRWKQHVYESRQNRRNIKFMNAIRKYGEGTWLHEILESNINTLKEAQEKECYYIKLYDTYNKGYNTTLGGEGVDIIYDVHPLKNKPKTAEHIAKSVLGRAITRSKYTQQQKELINEHVRNALLKRYNSKPVTLYHKDYGIVTDLLCNLIKKYNIHTEIYNVIKGKRRYVQGWFLYVGEGNYDIDPVYTFVHNEHGEVTGTLKEISEKYSLSKGNLCSVAKGKCEQTKGWRLKI